LLYIFSGTRPLPPTPEWTINSSADSDTSAEYINIDDFDKQPQRKSSIPTQPPPLPPVMTEDDDDSINLKHPSVKPPRPSASSLRNWKTQNFERKVSANSSNSEEENSNSRKIHPIAQMLKKSHNHLLTRLSTGSESQDSHERTRPQLNGKAKITKPQSDRVKSKARIKPKLSSKPDENFNNPSSSPACNSSSVRSKKPPIVPNKLPQNTNENFQRRETTDCLLNVPKKPARNNRRNLQTSSPKKSLTSSTESQSNKEISKNIYVKPPTSPLPKSEPDQRINSYSEINAQIVSNKKRIKGYTLHKLQAQRLDSQEKLCKGQSAQSHSIPEAAVSNDSNTTDDVNTYHAIEDDHDKDQLKTLTEKKEMSLLTSQSSDAIDPVQDDVDNVVSSSASQKTHSPTPAIPKSPNIKSKPRPKVPPPPRPTTTPFQAKETKRKELQ